MLTGDRCKAFRCQTALEDEAHTGITLMHRCCCSCMENAVGSCHGIKSVRIRLTTLAHQPRIDLLPAVGSFRKFFWNRAGKPLPFRSSMTKLISVWGNRSTSAPFIACGRSAPIEAGSKINPFHSGNRPGQNHSTLAIPLNGKVYIGSTIRIIPALMFGSTPLDEERMDCCGLIGILYSQITRSPYRVPNPRTLNLRTP